MFMFKHREHSIASSFHHRLIQPIQINTTLSLCLANMIFGILDCFLEGTLYLTWPKFLEKLNTLDGEFETELRAQESLRSLHDNPSSPIVLSLYVFKIHIIKIANYPWKKIVVFYKLSYNYFDSMVFSKCIQCTCSVLLNSSAIAVFSGKIVKVHKLSFIQYTVNF